MRALFARRLGNAWISQFVSRESRANGSKLVSVEVIIRDLALIRALPVPPEGRFSLPRIEQEITPWSHSLSCDLAWDHRRRS